jgi:hypothetical protein
MMDSTVPPKLTWKTRRSCDEVDLFFIYFFNKKVAPKPEPAAKRTQLRRGMTKTKKKQRGTKKQHVAYNVPALVVTLEQSLYMSQRPRWSQKA